MSVDNNIVGGIGASGCMTPAGNACEQRYYADATKEHGYAKQYF